MLHVYNNYNIYRMLSCVHRSTAAKPQTVMHTAGNTILGRIHRRANAALL